MTQGCAKTCGNLPLPGTEGAQTLALGLLLITGISSAQVTYDLLLKGGHVIDPKNLNAVRDVAIAQGRIAVVAAGIPASKAYKTVNVAGFYVTPGLWIYTRTCSRAAARPWEETLSVYPDSHTFRSGVTTVVDPPGCDSKAP